MTLLRDFGFELKMVNSFRQVFSFFEVFIKDNFFKIGFAFKLHVHDVKNLSISLANHSLLRHRDNFHIDKLLINLKSIFKYPGNKKY